MARLWVVAALWGVERLAVPPLLAVLPLLVERVQFVGGAVGRVQSDFLIGTLRTDHATSGTACRTLDRASESVGRVGVEQRKVRTKRGRIA